MKDNIKVNKDRLENTHVTIGKSLGYPNCCIEEFLQIYQVGSVEPRKLNGTGYVPCLNCNELSEEELINNINKNRKCPVQFPKIEFHREVKRLGLVNE